MDHDSSNPYDVGGFLYPFHRIEQEGLAKPLSLLANINCQAGKQYDSYGVIRESFCNSLRALMLVYRPCS